MDNIFYHFKPYETEAGSKYSIVRIVNVRIEPSIFNAALGTVRDHSLAKGKDGWFVHDKYADLVKKTGGELFDKLPKEQQIAIHDYLEMNG